MSDGVDLHSRPTHLDLCSGIGGFSLGARWAGFRTVCYVEQNEWCQRLLVERMRSGDLDEGLLWDDLTTFRGEPWRGRVDLLTAGFPCQPFSCAGQRRAEQDERNLWPDVERVIDEVRPGYVLLENSPGILGTGRATFGRILGFFSETGYRVEWQTLPLASFGAPHIRFRTWVVAHAEGLGEPLRSSARGRSRGSTGGAAHPLTHGEGERLPLGDGGARDRSQEAQPERRGKDPPPNDHRERQQQRGRRLGEERGRPGDGAADPAAHGDDERQERGGRSGARGRDELANGSRAGWESPDSHPARLEIFPREQADFRRECEAAARGAFIRGWGAPEPTPRGVDVCVPEGLDAATLWSAWPDVPGLIGPGLPHRRQRVEGLGNTVCPVLVYWLAGRILRHMRGD